MEKLTGKYETIFIVNATLADDQIAAAVEKFRSVIESNGTVEKVEEWGKRKLAYPINYMNDGYYVLITFTSDKDFPLELDRLYNINDAIIRSIIVKVEE